MDSRRPSSAELGDNMSDGIPNGDLHKPEAIVEEIEPEEPAETSEYEKKKQSFITRYDTKQS